MNRKSAASIATQRELGSKGCESALFEKKREPRVLQEEGDNLAISKRS